MLEETERGDVWTRHLLNETAAALAEDDDRFTQFK